MRRAIPAVLFVLFVLSILGCMRLEASILYGATGGSAASQLYLIDPANGTATAIGPIGFAVTGLASKPGTGVLYGSTTPMSPVCPNCLITINRLTGAGTIVGMLTPLQNAVPDLAFSPAGTLYGWLEGPDGLAVINIATGSASLIAPSTLNTFGDGLAFNPGGVLYVMPEGDDQHLYTVNPATGLPTLVASLTGSPCGGCSISTATFDPAGQLFASVMNFNNMPPSYLTRVSTSTGNITTLGPTVTNLDALEFGPDPKVSINNISQAEGAIGTSNFTFTLTLDTPSLLPVTVNYATANGTATAGSDYVASSGSVTFPPLTTSRPLTILVNGDTMVEPNETFTVTLSSPVNAAIGTGTGTATILDDEGPGVDLAVTQTADRTSIVSGNPVTFSISITNGGPSTATGVVVTDTLPAGFTFVSAVPSQGTCSGTSVITCNVGTLLLGANATITVTALAGGISGANVVTATANEMEFNALNNTSSVTVTIVPGKTPVLGSFSLVLLAAALAMAALVTLRQVS